MPDHTASGEPELLTMTEAAELLRAPVATLRYWRHLGTGPRGFRLGRRVLYRRDDLKAWIDAPAAAERCRPALTRLLVSHNTNALEIRFTHSARKHRIGRTSARHVMDSTEPTPVTTTNGADAWLYVGPDERGRELEIIAVESQPANAAPYLLVIHVMPTQFRG
jgi:excisionase family DNA binding protein